MVSEKLEIPTMFKRGGKEHDWKVIPEFNDDCDWVKDQSDILLGMKLDGMICRIDDDKKLTRKMGEFYFNVNLESPHITDIPIVEAYKDASEGMTLPSGFYVAVGPGCNGNNHQLSSNSMVRIAPPDALVLVGWGSTVIKRGVNVTVKEFYDSIRSELQDSTVQGLVFYWEKPTFVPYKMAKITRRDFGFDWPIKPPPSGGIVDPYISEDGTVYEMCG